MAVRGGWAHEALCAHGPHARGRREAVQRGSAIPSHYTVLAIDYDRRFLHFAHFLATGGAVVAKIGISATNYIWKRK